MKTVDHIKPLVRLIHFLSSGSVIIDNLGVKWHIAGMENEDIIKFLKSPLKKKKNLTVYECIYFEGDAFVNEIITYINEREQF